MLSVNHILLFMSYFLPHGTPCERRIYHPFLPVILGKRVPYSLTTAQLEIFTEEFCPGKDCTPFVCAGIKRCIEKGTKSWQGQKFPIVKFFIPSAAEDTVMAGVQDKRANNGQLRPTWSCSGSRQGAVRLTMLPSPAPSVLLRRSGVAGGVPVSSAESAPAQVAHSGIKATLLLCAYIWHILYIRYDIMLLYICMLLPGR